MILTVMRISWLHLLRDRVALVLTFALPIALFSFFALVFGQMDTEATRIRVAVLSSDTHPVSSELERRIVEDPQLEVVDVPSHLASASVEPAEAARAMVRSGQVSVALVVPAGFGDSLARPVPLPTQVELFADHAHPIALRLMRGALQRRWLDPDLDARVGDDSFAGGAVRVSVENVLGNERKRPSIAYFAAGTGVLFLLFAVSGRSAILLEERESGVLKRMLGSGLGMTRLLFARWLLLVVLGSVQVAVMFVWGSIAFGLELWTPRHLIGFTAITLATAAAAAGFGLLLSTACRSRAQLNGVAAVVILALSALGGSMFPRFLMPEWLQQVGLLTFNAWALTGYQKVFWYETAPAALWPQLLALTAFAVLFLGSARILARRWESS